MLFGSEKDDANVSPLEFYQDQLILRHTNTEHVGWSLQSYMKKTDPRSSQPGEIKKCMNHQFPSTLNTNQQKPTQPSEHCFSQTVP